MPSARSTPLPVRLDRAARTPLAVQLAGQIRGLVTAGAPATGDRLPSTRALAAELGVSRAVTEQAYDQLLAEGWLEARRGAGTFVAASGHLALPVPVAPVRERPRARHRFDTGTPWLDPRQAAGWRRAWRDVAAATPPPGYPDPRGLPALRSALAGHLARTRGLTHRADELLVTHGTTDGLRLLLPELPPGPVAVEDPGYRAAVRVAVEAGRGVADVPVAADGLAVPALPASAAAVYVTPAHQHPLGVTMAAATRLALLEYAGTTGALVVEDDYDSEFRYDVAPLPALAALDRDRVVYLGTASKAVSPGLRLGWLAGPPELVERIAARREVTHDVPSWPVQRAYLSMLEEGYVDRVVRSARRVYARRGELVRRRLTGLGELVGAPAGMYATLLLDAARAERARLAALAAGYDVPLLADYARTAALSGLVLGYGGCTDAQLDRVLDVLARALTASGGDY